MITSVINGIKLGLILKIMYMIVIRVVVGRIIIMYILGLVIIRVAILYVLRSYIGYWMLNIRLLVLGVIFYLIVDFKFV